MLYATVLLTGFEAALEDARERSKASGKKAGQVGLKFEAEATGWLQKNNVPLTVCGGSTHAHRHIDTRTHAPTHKDMER